MGAEGEGAAADGGMGRLGDFLGAGEAPAAAVAIPAPSCGSKVEKTGRFLTYFPWG